MTKTYSYDEALEASTNYFNGSSLPAKVFVDKYALRDTSNNLLESLPSDMHKRLAKELARIEAGKFSQPLSYETIYSYLDNFKKLIPQGSILYGMGNYSQYVTLSNCYVLDEMLDSYGGIHYADEQISQISKRRGGCGTSLDHLRPEGMITKNSSRTTTGIIPFAERLSNSIREVGQNGRRGALMLTLNVHHPQILDFARVKLDTTKVTGANLSVMLTNEFLQAVENDAEYEQRWPVGGFTHNTDGTLAPTMSRMVPAREVWNEIIKCAHQMAEPGLLFWDNIISESPADCYCTAGFRTIGTNPCVTKDTWIMTNRGPKQVVDLIGIPFNAEVDGITQQTSINGFFHTGFKDIWELKTSSGFSIKCTSDHKIKKVSKLSRKIKTTEFVELQNLNIGDMINLNNHRASVWYDGLGNREQGWLVGNLLGDGCFTEDTCKLEYWKEEKLPLYQHAVQLIKNNFKCRADIGTATDTSYNVLTLDKKSIKSIELAKYAIGMGLSASKDLSVDIEKTSIEFHKGFLSGWLDADGTIHPDKQKGNYVSLSSSKLDNLKIAQRMFARLGIITTIYEERAEKGLRSLPNGKGGYSDYECEATHDLRISNDNLVQFAALVGFANPIKQDKLMYMISSYQRNYNRERFVDTIKSITYIGKEDVYDCTVPNIHEFDANGISIHNCSELPLSALDSCRLLLMNLMAYVRNPFSSESYFDYKEFYGDAQIAQRLLDDVIDIELEHVDRIINKIKSDPEPEHIKQTELTIWGKVRKSCFNGRRTGLGPTALGDTLAALGIKYGTDESISVVEQIYKTLKFGSYRSSVDMAKELGPFPVWDWELEKDNPFINRIKDEAIVLNGQDLAKDNTSWIDAINGYELWSDIKKYGRRNIANLTTAPAGSMSIMAWAGELGYGYRGFFADIIFGTSSGIEPAFMLDYSRLKKVNPNDEGVRVDFVDANGDSWQKFQIYHPSVQVWMAVTGETDLTKSPWYGACAEDIDWTQRVKLQSAAQKHVDHAISSTINLPEDVSVEKVAEIYEAAWKSGCKGMTVYRKNCRTGVLIENKAEEKEVLPAHRPKQVVCDVHHVTVKSKEYFVLVGLVNDKPYEVFAGRNGFLKKKIKHGTVTRVRKGYYKAEFEDGTELVPLTAASDEHEEAMTRLISTALHQGAEVAAIVNQLEKINGDMYGFTRSIARALKKYIPDGTEVKGEVCPECSATTIIREEGCKKCSSCGFSKCM